MDNIILMSISESELKKLIQDAVREELNLKKENELLSFKATCKFLGVSPSWLNKQKSENKIPYKKMGKRIFFIRSEILANLEDNKFYKLKNIIG